MKRYGPSKCKRFCISGKETRFGLIPAHGVEENDPSLSIHRQRTIVIEIEWLAMSRARRVKIKAKVREGRCEIFDIPCLEFLPMVPLLMRGKSLAMVSIAHGRRLFSINDRPRIQGSGPCK